VDLTSTGLEAAVTGWLQRTTASQRRAAIREELNRLDLVHHHVGGAFVPLYCLPFALPQEQFRQAKRRAELLVRVLVNGERAALANPGGPLHERLRDSLSPGGRYLVEQSGHESAFSLERRFRRLDGFLSGSQGYQIIEVNQAAPLASSYHDAVHRFGAALLERMGIPWRPPLLVPLIAEWLVGEYQNRHGRDRLPRRVAIPVEHGYPPKFSDLPAVASAAERFALRRWGERIEFTVCLPWELYRDGERLRLRGKAYDLIWRNTVYLSSYRVHGPDVSEYEQICADSARYLVVNSGRSWWTRTKEALAVVWDDRHRADLGLSPTQLQEVRGSVPETANLRHQPEYVDEVIGRRRDWVSKPADSGFGQGVEFGANHTETSWRHLVGERRTGGYVFQRLVVPEQVRLTQMTLAGEVTQVVLEGDLCPYHVDGEVSGPILMRAVPARPEATGQRQQMNLTQGGALIPVLVASDGDDG
jgi:hypothetical protein